MTPEPWHGLGRRWLCLRPRWTALAALKGPDGHGGLPVEPPLSRANARQWPPAHRVGGSPCRRLAAVRGRCEFVSNFTDCYRPLEPNGARFGLRPYPTDSRPTSTLKIVADVALPVTLTRAHL